MENTEEERGFLGPQEHRLEEDSEKILGKSRRLKREEGGGARPQEVRFAASKGSGQRETVPAVCRTPRARVSWFRSHQRTAGREEIGGACSIPHGRERGRQKNLKFLKGERTKAPEEKKARVGGSALGD